MHYDILIIGSGITGVSIAFELSKYDLKVGLIEKENDISMKTTKANSGIIHAGYDPKSETLMAKLNVLGSNLIHDLAPILNFHYEQCGSLVIGSSEDDHLLINTLYERGLKNGVKDMYLLKTTKEVHALEPHLAKEIDYALYSKSAGIVSPWEMALAFAYTAKTNGVDFYFDSPVKDITKKDNLFEVVAGDKTFTSDYVINCAGVHADDIFKLVLKEKAEEGFTITPVKGEYYLLDKDQGELVNRVIFQTPTKSGKGVLVSKTVHGNLIVGPNAMSQEKDGKEDTSTRNEALGYVRSASVRSVPEINFSKNIRNFSGVRATLKDRDDFLIEESPLVKGFIHFAGIKSPGLSCGPAFGIYAVELLKKSGKKMNKKEYFKYYPLPKYFSEMSLEEKRVAILKDNRYGQVICRCETVTEAEIVEALHAPIPARTIDAIKRRTNAGMGRCQGGFCGPKIFKIIMETLHLDYKDVYQDVTGSSICIEQTKD